jgi:chromosome partitioning protein
MGLIIATVNMKGGVGKTTLTVNLAACLAKLHGKRVLVVDLDTQISATLSMLTPQDLPKFAARKKRSLIRLLKFSSRAVATNLIPKI